MKSAEGNSIDCQFTKAHFIVMSFGTDALLPPVLAGCLAESSSVEHSRTARLPFKISSSLQAFVFKSRHRAFFCIYAAQFKGFNVRYTNLSFLLYAFFPHILLFLVETYAEQY